MGAIDISLIDLSKIFLLLIPVFIINRSMNININKKVSASIIRMVVQLAMVGVFLEYIFTKNSPLLNFLYLNIMIVAAVYSALKSTNLNILKFAKPIAISFFLPLFVVLIYFLNVVIKSPNALDAQYAIPISGMLLGNSLRGIIVSLDSFYNSILENENEYIYSLSLSASRTESLRPYMKKALILSINPTIASIETIGLVSLPGMMTGQILGGSVPFTAIKYQIAIMVAIFASKYMSTLLVIYLSSMDAFDEYDMITDIRAKGKT